MSKEWWCYSPMKFPGLAIESVKTEPDLRTGTLKVDVQAMKCDSRWPLGVEMFMEKLNKVFSEDTSTQSKVLPEINWKDNVKSVVKCQPGDTFDYEKGFAFAYLKRLFGNDNTFNKVLRKWVGEWTE